MPGSVVPHSALCSQVLQAPTLSVVPPLLLALPLLLDELPLFPPGR